MTTATLVPLEEYLHTSYHPDCDWVDGELKERNVGEFSHSSVQRLLLKFFLLCEEELGYIAYPELRLQVSQSNYRVPDVMLREATAPYERIITSAPPLCIEVLSPDDRMSDMDEKIADYLAMGVGTVWVIDPRRRSALQIDSEGQRSTTTLTAKGIDFTLPLQRIFAELEKMDARARDQA